MLLFVAWNRFQSWYIFGSAFTDLPGQDSLGLTKELELVVFAVITLVAGRVAGLLSRTRRWVAAAIGVLPLVLLLVVSVDEGNPMDALPWCILTYLVGLAGAYAPRWSFRWKRREPSVGNGAA